MGDRFGNVTRFRASHPWRLLLIDAHDFTRQCMADLLSGTDEELDVRTAASVEDADPAECVGCAVALLRLDGARPDELALRGALGDLGDLMPEVPVALLGGQCEIETALAAIRCGVRGYLSASLGIEQILSALRLISAGGIYIAPAQGMNGLRLAAAERPRPDSLNAMLTPREAQVLAHLRQGKPNKLIAYELGMSENTVKAHVGHILKKLGATNRTVIACLPGTGEA